MRPYTSALSSLLLFILGVGAALAQTAPVQIAPAQPRTVQVGDLPTRVLTIGLESRREGQPVVIFQNGAGSTLRSWDNVTGAVGKFAPVIVYNRPGIGGSASDGQPPTIEVVNAHLDELLTTLGAAPPYVLVGHSWGGALIHFHAGQRPRDVIGVVYVDPTDFTQPDFPDPVFDAMGIDTAAQRIVIAEFEADMRKYFAEAPPEIRAEIDVIDEFMNRDVADRRLPAMPGCPVAVILGGRPAPTPDIALSVPLDWDVLAAEQLRARLRMGQKIIENNPNATLVLANHAEHYVQKDDPDLIVEAIRRVMFPPALPYLAHVIGKRGIEAGIAEYHRMHRQYPSGHFTEQLLNGLGYEYLRNDEIEHAIAIFELNVAEYPDAANPYDSLGEAYMKSGDREKAVKNYRKSLELNPQNTNAVRMLEQMEAD